MKFGLTDYKKKYAKEDQSGGESSDEFYCPSTTDLQKLDKED